MYTLIAQPRRWRQCSSPAESGIICSPPGLDSGPIDTPFGVFRTGALGRVIGYPLYEPGETTRNVIPSGTDPSRPLRIYTGDWSEHSENYLPLAFRSY